MTNAIIFANRKTTVSILEKSLLKHKFNAGALHGDMDQFSRLKTLDAFRAGEISYLIASDVAARGLDIPQVSHVFNYDVPVHSEDYVHRIGRTGRAGREGRALTLVKLEEIKALKAIEELIGKSIDWQGEAPNEDEIADAMTAKGRRRRGAKTKAKAKGAIKSVKAEKSDKPKAKAAKADKPKEAKQPKATQPSDDAPRKKERRERDPLGFTPSNMPAFLARPVERA